MSFIGDMVLENVSAPGTGTFSLGGAPTGRVTFGLLFANGANVYYVATDGTQTEIGIGVFATGSPNTITRNTVLFTSAQGYTSPTKRNFTGTTRVYTGIPANKAVFIDNFTTLSSGSQWYVLTPYGHLMQFGSGQTDGAGVGNVTFPIGFPSLAPKIVCTSVVSGFGAAVHMQVGSKSQAGFSALSSNPATGAFVAGGFYDYVAMGF